MQLGLKLGLDSSPHPLYNYKIEVPEVTDGEARQRSDGQSGEVSHYPPGLKLELDSSPYPLYNYKIEVPEVNRWRSKPEKL